MADYLNYVVSTLSSVMASSKKLAFTEREIHSLYNNVEGKGGLRSSLQRVRMSLAHVLQSYPEKFQRRGEGLWCSLYSSAKKLDREKRKTWIKVNKSNTSIKRNENGNRNEQNQVNGNCRNWDSYSEDLNNRDNRQYDVISRRQRSRSPTAERDNREYGIYSTSDNRTNHRNPNSNEINYRFASFSLDDRDQSRINVAEPNFIVSRRPNTRSSTPQQGTSSDFSSKMFTNDLYNDSTNFSSRERSVQSKDFLVKTESFSSNYISRQRDPSTKRENEGLYLGPLILPRLCEQELGFHLYREVEINYSGPTNVLLGRTQDDVRFYGITELGAEAVMGQLYSFPSMFENWKNPLREIRYHGRSPRKFVAAISEHRQFLEQSSGFWQFRIENFCGLTSFSVRLTEFEADFLKMSDALDKAAKNREAPLIRWNVGDGCIFQDLLYSWSRAVILKIEDNTFCHVLAVDLGKEHFIRIDRLKDIPYEYLNIRPFSIRCTIAADELEYDALMRKNWNERIEQLCGKSYLVINSKFENELGRPSYGVDVYVKNEENELINIKNLD